MDVWSIYVLYLYHLYLNYVFGLNRPRCEPTIYHTQGKHAYHYMTHLYLNNCNSFGQLTSDSNGRPTVYKYLCVKCETCYMWSGFSHVMVSVLALSVVERRFAPRSVQSKDVKLFWTKLGIFRNKTYFMNRDF
jgi:hypothetical protein